MSDIEEAQKQADELVAMLDVSNKVCGYDKQPCVREKCAFWVLTKVTKPNKALQGISTPGSPQTVVETIWTCAQVVAAISKPVPVLIPVGGAMPMRTGQGGM